MSGALNLQMRPVIRKRPVLICLGGGNVNDAPVQRELARDRTIKFNPLIGHRGFIAMRQAPKSITTRRQVFLEEETAKAE
jgi:hypothetical protein